MMRYANWLRGAAALAAWMLAGLAHADRWVTTVSTVTTAGAVAANAATNRVWLEASGSLAYLDGATNALTYVQVPVATADAIAVNPVTNKVFVGNGDSSITVVDGVSLATTAVPTGTDPHAFAIDTARNRIYVTNRGSGTVTVIDGATLATTAVTVGTNPTGIAVNTTTNRIYVANNGSNNVSVIDGDSLAVTTVAAGTGPLAVAVDPVINRAYVSNSGSDSVTVIYGADNSTSTVATPDVPSSIAVNTATNRIYVAASGSQPTSTGVITVIDAFTLATTPVTAGANCCDIAVDVDTNKIYATSPGYPITSGGTLTVIDGATNATQVINKPGGRVALNPLTNRIYTTYSGAVSTFRFGQLHVFQATSNAACDATDCPDLVVTQAAAPAMPSTGKDLVIDITTDNVGTASASNVVLETPLPAGASFVWASPTCTYAAATLTCNFGAMPPFAPRTVRFVVRPVASGPLASVPTATGSEADANPGDNTGSRGFAVSSSPGGVPVLRYRLYSPVTREHHFTTDLNEYTVLGSYTGTWIQEGTVGKVLDNPGTYNGVAAVPYYRLYDTNTAWHHWTRDPNEYYTLIQFPGWNAEGVDGYILPSAAAGTTPLHRLLYPFVAGLHHWTIDANEQATLVSSYGWIDEGVAGFVIP